MRGSASAGGTGRAYRGRRIRPRWGRIALVAGLALLLVAGVGAFAAWRYAASLDKNMSRTDPFSKIKGDRPGKTVKGALNILMLGSDSRDPSNKANAGKWRTDTIMLMHIPASHDKAEIISIPRDTYAFIPQSPTDPNLGNTKAKINAAFAWGGLPLMIQAVEGFTGVRVDHVVLIDFGGFKEVTDALGGVDMNVEKTIKSIHKPYRTFTKGKHHFNGTEALDYCRQRYQFPDSDFARMRHQQQFLKALMDKAASGGTLGNPFKLNAFLRSVTKALTVDKDFSITDMALQFRDIRSKDMTFMTSPNLGGQTINGESVVVSDREKAAALYDAVVKDKVEEWIAANPSAVKPSS